ncbi:YcdB/YcdC domain-containing protein [Clostridium aminobutyricum]|uniref:S-layer homology domain-containing protein n=1 Tax=Clostridium aminobutyricum TaxID=33953 RepID=A0A939DAW9_CLOAM|nr:S-layer homology domain-containing protein [Clostridium aminobutyricum]MBN7774381.1 S-layer homology domain-containing protein [Clostridium aminobutyricum]
MKRLVSGITAIALLVMTAAASTSVSFAGTSESEDLQKAIATVKTVVSIPTELSEFSYYKDDNVENRGGWNLNWSAPEGDGYISASVEGTDTITSYYCYLKNFNGDGLAKVTETQAQKVADDTLKKMLPKYAHSMKLEENTAARSAYDSDYSFLYKMYINDIPCDFITVSIGVNKYVGQLSHFRYNCNASDFAITGYPSTDKIFAEDAAKAAYLKELGPELKYFSNYDYSKKTLKVYPAYETNDSNRAIDAQTGKVIDLYAEYQLYNTRDAATMGSFDYKSASENAIEYTEQELNEIQKTAGLLSKTEADNRAKEWIPSLRGETISSSSLAKNNGPDQSYIWNLSYKDGYVTLDAKSGVLLNFYNYSDYSTPTKDIGLKSAKSIADDYLKKVCSDKLDQVTWSNENSMGVTDYNYTFIYTRQINDIPFDSNAIYVSVNKQNGKILSYSRTWYESATFPDLNGVLTKEAAFDATDKYGDFGLSYRKTAVDKVALVYKFLKSDTYKIDAFTGKQLSWDGTVYEQKNLDYTDIAGTWAEHIILELKNNGYYLEGSQFAPKAKTTQIDFFRYLYSPEQAYYNSDEDFYKMLVSQKIIKKEEINAAAAITRQDAAKFIIRYLGYDKLASKSDIFKNMYKDKIDSNYLGYASSVYGLGIMKGDAKGYFNGGNTLTHAEAAVVIYNTLNAR